MDGQKLVLRFSKIQLRPRCCVRLAWRLE